MTPRAVVSLSHFLRSENGTATIEFVFVIPIVMMIFMASFESSFYMARHVMLERSLDMTMRELRLGMLGAVTHADLKKRICERGVFLGSAADCLKSMKIWLQPIDTISFGMPTTPPTCVDRLQNIDPLLDPPTAEYARGTANQIMLVRVCLQEDPMFPTTPVGAQLIKNSVDGGYSIVSSSVFVNEPS